MQRRLFVVAAAVLATACLVQAGSAAAASWSATATAVGGLDRSLAVSCSAANACTAVGDAIALGEEPDVSLAERWNGRRWSLQSLPRPAGSTAEALGGVACPSADTCFAVGFAIQGGTLRPLALRWNGNVEAGPVGWSLQELPTPEGGAFASVNAISCSSETACTAVGFNEGPGFATRTLVYRWDGSRWSIQESPNPTGNNQLYDVSCPSASACTAVGYEIGAGDAEPLVETWDGSTWSVQSAAIPTGSVSTTFAGVSCTAANACTAVGRWSGEASSHTLAERWDGSRWTVQSTPDAEFQNHLLSVSCSSTTACTAAGEGSGANEALVERWDGSRWSLDTVTQPGTPALFYAVDCTAAASCMAAGNYETPEAVIHNLAEQLSGTTWSVTATPAGGDDRLRGDACATASDCTAVGEATPLGSGVEGPLAEHWDGSSWSAESVGRAEGAIGGRLFGVACPLEEACVAVGDATDAATGARSALAETASRFGFSPQPVPQPEGATTTTLRGVSCSSASECTAVGSFAARGGARTFAVRWNGSEWTLQPSPNPAEARAARLTGVACASASACTAVGTWKDRSGRTLPLTERWDGSSWTLQSPAIPAEAGDVTLRGVACSAASACTAVGTYATSEGARTLAERWDGTSWTLQTTPNVEAGNLLTGVACSSSTSCVAVGHGAGSAEALVERWTGGAWSIEEAVSPGSASRLLGVACVSEAVCMATGAVRVETGGGFHATRSMAEHSE